MSLNTISLNKSVSEQRESLLELNNDLLYWVYWLKNESDDSLDLEYFEWVLTCYPNQLENLKWLDENSDITILNLWSLRKWNVEILSWKNQEVINPVLLSNWVIEMIEAKNKAWEIKNHLISTLRDWWSVDDLQRTTTAWRNSWNDLNGDLEREHIEESPFLWYDKDGNLALCSIDNSEKSMKLLFESIDFYLKFKYLNSSDKNYDFVKKNFKRSFPWIEYDDFWDILREIIREKRVCTYSIENKDDLEWLESDMKEISLSENKWNYFTYFDKENNTIEYRLLRTITWFNEWFKPLSNRPSRLYLESENQYPRMPRIENASEWYVPTIEYFSNRVKNIIN